MSDRVVWTLAYWDLIKCRWVAALTSDVRERIEAVNEVNSTLFPAVLFYIVSGSDDVEAIEARVAALEPPDVDVLLRCFVAVVELLFKLRDEQSSWEPPPRGGRTLQ